MFFEIGIRYTLETAQGLISTTGIDLVTAFIGNQNLQADEWKAVNPNSGLPFLPPLPADWQWVWVLGKGEYAGTLPKRVSKYYYKVHGLNCPRHFIEQLGNIAKAHSESAEWYEFDFTSEFNWRDGDYGDDGSCFWSYNAGARQMLQNNGGLAIRFYSEYRGIARAWVVPIEDGMFIVFNGYGFSTLEIARIFAQFANLVYKKIDLTNNSNETGTLYINGTGIGYLIGTAAQVEEIDDYDFGWDDEYACTCERCGDYIHEGDGYVGTNGYDYCQDCFYEMFDYCHNCDETFYREDLNYIGDYDYCERCTDRLFTMCDECSEYADKDDIVEISGNYYCSSCADDIEPDIEE